MAFKFAPMVHTKMEYMHEVGFFYWRRIAYKVVYYIEV